MSLLMNLGGGAIGGLFGGGAQAKQKKRELAYRRQIMELLGPQAQLGRQNQFYSQFMQSPAFTQAARGAAARGNTLQNNLASSLGARGLGTTGIGSIAPALARSAAGAQLGNVRTQAYGMAGQQARQSINDQIAALQNLGPESGASFGRGFGAGIGGGISDFSNFLLNYTGSPQAKVRKSSQPAWAGAEMP
jgi:hypothetical protein